MRRGEIMKRILAALAFAVTLPAFAAPDTTTIRGTIYLPGGATPATAGSISAALSASASADDGGTPAVVAGRVSATITPRHCSVTTATLCAADGDCPGGETCINVTIALVPNDAMTPTGTYYTVSYSVTSPTAAQWTEKWTITTAPDPIAIGSVTRVDTPPGMAAPVSTIMDEGTAVTKRTRLNFTGSGVACADNSGQSRTDCTIPGGGGGAALIVQEGDATVDGAAATVDFLGADFVVTSSPAGEANVSVEPVYIKESEIGAGLAVAGGTVSLGYADDLTTQTPALLARECRFTSASAACPNGGIICEGGTANAGQTVLCIATTSATLDKTINFPLIGAASTATLSALELAATWSGIQTWGNVAHVHSGAETHSGAEVFSGGPSFTTVAPTFTAGATFPASEVATRAPGTSSASDAAVVRVTPTNAFPSAAVPAAWQASTAYTTPISVSNNTGKQYLLVTNGTSAGSGGPTGTGLCTSSGVSSGTAFPGSPAVGDYFAVTDDSAAGACDSAAGAATTVCRWSGSVWAAVICTAPNGTDDHLECPGTGTCTNAKTDNTATWRYIGLVHAATATENDYVFLPTASGGNYDGLNGNDAEFVHQRGYNYLGTARQDTTEYALFEQFTWGWSQVSPLNRQGEWFVQHVTPGGTLWSPWAFNFNNVNTESPTADFTFKISPTVIGFQSNQEGTAFGPGGHAGKARLEAHGGDVYTDGCFKLDGPTVDGYNTRICAVDTAYDPHSLYIRPVPDSSTFVMSAKSSTSGPAAWAQGGISCDTACTNIGQENCADYVNLDGTNGIGADCSTSTGLRLCECY